MGLTARVSQQELIDATRADLHRTHIALLAQSRSGSVREVVARRDDVPFGVQAALSNDDVMEVRAAIAANPRAAVSVMNHLADDSHHAVLLALATNPSAPRDVAQKLAAHRRADIRNAAIRRLERRDVAAPAPAIDPDSRFPELSDRVSLTQEPVMDTPQWGIAVDTEYAGDGSLSRLAQHLTLGERVAQASRPLGSQTSGFRIAAAS